MNSHRSGAATALTGALLLGGCTTAPASEPDHETAPPTPIAPAAPEVTMQPNQSDVRDSQDLVDSPAADTDSRSAAITAAERVMTAFARPDLSETQWWNELLPLLSQTGASAYEGTLPENVPVTALTGSAAVIDGATDVITLVQVPTDAGVYVVTLTRGDATQPWLAERIRPANG